MQRTIYQCDECEKEIGKKPHLSIMLHNNNHGCGVAIPPRSPGNTQSSGWQVVGFGKNFVHFCNGQCAGRFFAKQIKIALGPKE